MHPHTQASFQPNTNPTKRSSRSVHREHRERAPAVERETIPQPIPVPQHDRMRRASVRPSRYESDTEWHRSRATTSHDHDYRERGHDHDHDYREREHDQDRDRPRDRPRRRHTYDPDHQTGSYGSRQWYNNV